MDKKIKRTIALEPNLLVPNKEPFRFTKVKKEHYIGKRVIGSWIFNVNNERDSTKKNNSELVGTLSRTYTPYGWASGSPGGENRILIQNVDQNNPLSGAPTDSLSFYFFSYLPTVAENNGFNSVSVIDKSSAGGAANGWSISYFIGSSRGLFEFNQSGSRVSEMGSSVPLQVFSGIGLTAKAGEPGRWYLDGQLYSTDGLINSYSTVTTNLSIFNRNASFSDRTFLGPVVCMHVIAGELSDEEHLRIHLSRYSILETE